MSDLFTKPSPDRPWFKRLTVLGGALLAALVSLQTAGVVPGGTAEGVQEGAALVVELAKVLASVLTGLGVYRHIAN